MTPDVPPSLGLLVGQQEEGKNIKSTKSRGKASFQRDGNEVSHNPSRSLKTLFIYFFFTDNDANDVYGTKKIGKKKNSLATLPKKGLVRGSFKEIGKNSN